MNLSLNFSTCPNDTFMFYALVHGLLTDKYTFDVHMADIEDLNLLALEAKPDITKVSYGAYPLIAEHYQLLDSGSALGKGVGPLLISTESIPFEQVKHKRIALPGEHTTAHLLFNLVFPDVHDKRFYLFSEIEDAILNNEVDAGVIIHESRFTYQFKGLTKLMDLGDEWEKMSGLPTPLGGIAIRRSLPDNIKHDINRLLKESVEYAFQYPENTMGFVSQFAQELSTEVMRNHISLYVNDFSITLGQVGRKAIIQLISSSKPAYNFDERSVFVYE
ncbi:1,4-dihydroxy-6-naphthoate synthase [Tenuifilum osseticum]|uniref:1,4-dihydroxy-6-naphthoate synthase n=1 Tax=Tenuifilum osseticum TaxID=3374723 RepID=UPI0034E53834